MALINNLGRPMSKSRLDYRANKAWRATKTKSAQIA